MVRVNGSLSTREGILYASAQQCEQLSWKLRSAFNFRFRIIALRERQGEISHVTVFDPLMRERPRGALFVSVTDSCCLPAKIHATERGIFVWTRA